MATAEDAPTHTSADGFAPTLPRRRKTGSSGSLQHIRSLFLEAEAAGSAGAGATPSEGATPAGGSPRTPSTARPSPSPFVGYDRLSSTSDQPPGTPPLDDSASRAAVACRSASRAASLKKHDRLSKLHRQRSMRWQYSGGEEADPATGPAVVSLPLVRGVAAKLESDAHRAADFLRRLQQPVYSRTRATTEPAMPKTALRFAKGLVFSWEQKAGCVLGVSWARGLLLAQLPSGRWSAPCFLVSRGISFGATLGYKQLFHCRALTTQAALDALKEDCADLAFDSTLMLGIDPLELDVPVKPMASSASKDPRRPREYVVGDGAILDLSFKCGFHFVDDGLNEEVYGTGVTADQVLAGRTPIPEQFRGLYEMINQMAQEAEVSKTTASQFELARKASLRPQRSTLRQAKSLLRRHSADGPAVAHASAGLAPWTSLTRNSSAGTSGSPPPGTSSGKLFPNVDLPLPEAEPAPASFGGKLFPEVEEMALGGQPSASAGSAELAPALPFGFGSVPEEQPVVVPSR